MSRPSDWSVLNYDSDPVPGDPDTVAIAGRDYSEVADAIQEAAANLRKLVESDAMKANSVDALRENALEVAENIEKAKERYAGVGDALTAYAPVLEHAQERTRQAHQDAEDAKELERGEQAEADDAEEADEDPPDYGDDGPPSQGAMTAALAKAAEAVQDRDDAADRAISAIDDVTDSGDLNDGWWENWGKSVVETITKIADAVAAIAGIAALVVGWIPVIGQALAGILGTIALVASIVSLAGKLTLALTGDGSWGDVAMAAIGVVTFGVGKAAMTGLKVSAAGVKGASRLAAGRQLAKAPGLRAPGIPRGSSSVGMRRLLGGTPANMSKNAARRMAKPSTRQGMIPSARSMWSDLKPRALVDEFADNARILARARGGSPSIDGLKDPYNLGLRLVGKHGEADMLAELKNITPALRNLPEVTPHVRSAYTQLGVANLQGAWGAYSAFTGMPSSDSNVDALNLTGPASFEGNVDFSGGDYPDHLGDLEAAQRG